jgi:hypothetical protein
VPSIHFLGKYGWAAQRAGEDASATRPPAALPVAAVAPPQKAAALSSPAVAHTPGAIEVWELPARFQRAAVSADEMDAVALGGAGHIWA